MSHLWWLYIFILCCHNGHNVPVEVYNDLTFMDNSHYYPEEGIYMEPAGQYLSYSGVILIPYVYVLPNIHVIHNPLCPGYKKVLSTYLNALEHIKTITGPSMREYTNSKDIHEHTARVKRSLFPIVSVLSGGLSVWNTIEIQGIKSKVQLLRTNMEHIDNALQSITYSQNKVIDQLGEMTILVSDHSKIINQLYNITHCLQQNQDEFMDVVAKWLYFAPIEFINAYSGAISGSITPSLLSATNLRQVLSTHREMESTLYINEPSIIYELGQVLITDIQVNSIAYIKGIIQLPRIMATSPLPMYNIYTVNVIKNGLDYIYDLPSVLVCPNIQTCWKPDYEKCTHRANRLLCIYGANTFPEICLSNLYQNKTDKCIYKVKKHDVPMAVQTGSGVLLGGSIINHKVFKRIGNIDVPHDVILRRDTSVLITQDKGDWISINDNIYNTRISGFSYNFTMYVTYSNDTYQVDPVKVEAKWKRIDEVAYTPIDFSQFAYNHGLLVFFLTISLILLSGLGYIYIQLRSLIAYKRITMTNRDHELIGLR